MQSQLTRLDCLLILRVLATFAVVLGHASSFFKGMRFTQWPQFPYIQNISVVLFFAVSGWTIAWLIDRRGDGFGRYLFDRVTRLAIPLIPALLLFAAIEFAFYGMAHPSKHFTLPNLLGNMIFLQDLNFHAPWMGIVYDPQISPFGLNRPLWTLSLEFWIYVAFGGFAFAVRGNTRAGLVGLFALSLISASVYGSRGAGLPLIWLAGALLYHAQKGATTMPNSARLALLPIWLYAVVALFDNSIWPPQGGYSATYNFAIFVNIAMFMLIIPGLSVNRSIMNAFTWFGKFAYTIYLVHYPIMHIIRVSDVLPNGSVSVLLAAVFCLACAWVISLPFEQQYQRIREWLWLVIFERRYARS